MKMSLRRFAHLVTVSAAALAVGACAEEVQSPKVSLTTVEPNLVCNDQRLSADAIVVLTGDGFTPMPTNVLAEPTILVLPEVKILKTQSLTGGAESGTEVIFPGEPGETLSNNVTWTSRSEMSVRISDADPAVELDPGLYDVTVTNPDGDKTVTVPQGLAVVPPPRIDAVEPTPPARCTAQGDKELTVSGENFLVVAGEKPLVTMVTDTPFDLEAAQVSPEDCTPIPGTFAGGTVELCNTLVLNLQDAKPVVGAYTVTVTSPAPASCASAESPVVYVAPEPFVDTVEPPAICVDQEAQIVTVNGGNFASIVTSGEKPTVEITGTDGTPHTYEPTLGGCATPEGLEDSFGLQLCSTLEITIGVNDLPVGDYKLTVINPEPVGCQSTEDIDITVNAPPDVTSVAPATVCSGGSIVRVTGTGFQDGATARLDCAGGSFDGVVTVVDATTADIMFGAGITAGEVCDVVFINADGCEDRPLPHETVTGTEGPILFNVDPNVAYNGIDTRVNLYVTALDGTFTVNMWPDGDASAPVELTSQLAPGKTTVIQAIIPAGTPATTAPDGYTLSVNDQSGCLASLPNAVQVTETLVVQAGTVTPPFGQDADSTAITISLNSDPGSTGVPRAFLNPTTGSDPAIQLKSVTVVDGTTLTAVVPASTPTGSYDLVIVWPDGNVAVLSAAYTSVSAAPPVVDNVNPQSINAQAGQVVTVTGTGFSGSTVSAECLTPGGAIVSAATTEQTEVCAAGACTQQATIDASAVGQPAACVIRVTNADGAYGEYSAVATTNSSLNLSGQPTAGTDLNTARRALVAAGIRASSAARYVYAIGGDDGAVTGAMDSVEFAAVDLFGALNPWVNSATSMGSARAFAGSTTIGRYVYVLGGNDGSGSLASAERALALSPDEIPEITNIDLCLSGGTADCFGVAGLADGLAAGVYSYRVAAVIDGADPVNLGGETLASDPIILRLRDIDQRLVAVSLDWTAPVDSAGTELSGITGYRIYRTPQDGSPGSDEQLLAEVDAATLSYIDDGSDTLDSAATPLPVGSTSAWQALPDMGAGREGLGVVAAMDPNDAATWYVYALLGQNGGTATSSYEFLPVTLQANGRQTVAASWTAGTEASNAARFNMGAWRLDDSVSGVTSGTTYIYLGSGSTAAGTTTGLVEFTTVGVGGQLAAFDDAGVNDVNGQGERDAYGAVAVGSATAAKLFVFGGRAANGGTPQAGAYGGATPSGGAPFPDVAWNGEGGFSLTPARAFMGTAIQSANVFMIGGTSNGTNALASTEHVVW